MAAFETGFHQTIPDRNTLLRRRRTSGPRSITSSGGDFTAPAIATSPRARPSCSAASDLRIISCHLGGSNSLCAIRDGKSVATSMGMSPQSGLPHNNRVGDFDPFALPVIMQAHGQVARRSARRPGRTERPAGLERRERRRARPGRSGRQRATSGRRLALDVFVGRHSPVPGGDAGRAGRRRRDRVHRRHRRERRQHSHGGVCADWKSWASCSTRRPTPRPRAKRRISAADSRTQIWIVPTNEEMIVARQTQATSGNRAKVNNHVRRQSHRLVVATQKVDSMVGHKLLIVEPYRIDAAGPQPAGHHRPHVRRGRHRRRRRRRVRADHARLERPPDAGNQEPADRRRDHRHRRHGARRPQLRLRSRQTRT